eukprot:2624373-Karenia_brevis.AAC.1
MLRKAGIRVAKLIRTGAAKAMNYGQGPLGVSPSLLLKQQRIAVGVLCDASSGGDLDLQLMLAD